MFSLSPPTATQEKENATQAAKDKAVVKPQRVWALRKQFSAIKDVALGAEGSIVLCTESGHVYVRSRNAKAGQTAGAKTFRFQRIPFLQRVGQVCANSTGAFAALRVDCRPVPIARVGNALAEDMAGVQPYLAGLGAAAAAAAAGEKSPVGGSGPAGSPVDEVDEGEGGTDDGFVKQDIKALAYLCDILARDKECRKAENRGVFHGRAVQHGGDLMIEVSAFEFPAHAVILAARSPVLFEVLLGNRTVKTETVTIKAQKGRAPPSRSSPSRVTFSGCHPLAVLILVQFLYTDELRAVWDRRVGLPIEQQLAPLKTNAAQIRAQLQELAKALGLPTLAAALDSHTKREPAPTLANDLRTLFAGAQSFVPGTIAVGARDPLAPDTVLELGDKSVFCHSAILRARSPFFAGFFDDEEWTSKRWQPDRTIRVDLKHMTWRPVKFVMDFIYHGSEETLFATLGEFCFRESLSSWS